MTHDVFISYATTDRPAATAVCARLEEAGIRCWIAPRDIQPGTDWASSIVHAIEDAQVMVLVFSTGTNGSHHVSREVELGVASDLTIVPFRIEAAEPEGSLRYFIGNAHWLDALTPPLEAHLAKLVDTVRAVTDVSAATAARARAAPSKGTPQRSRRSRTVYVAAAAILVIAVVAAVVAGMMNGSSSAVGGTCLSGHHWQQKDTPYPGGWLVITKDHARAGIVFGSALFGFSSTDAAVALVGHREDYHELSDGEYDSIDLRPRDGLLIREQPAPGTSGTGRLYYATAGAVFPIQSSASLRKIGLSADQAVVVSTRGLDQTPRIPASGTLLRVAGSRRTWVIEGGTRRPAANVCTGAYVNQLPPSPGVLDQIATAP